MKFANLINQSLLNLAWSLWTELGVAGSFKNHPNDVIFVEELILFSSTLMKVDPRLRDEIFDWCSQYEKFISMSRLKSLMPQFEPWCSDTYSEFAETMNLVSKSRWPIYKHAAPHKITPSGKSVLYPQQTAALLNIRARSIFGTGARADLISFFLVHAQSDISVAEATEIGYTKRNLADILDDLHFSKLFTKFKVGNQQKYRLNLDSPLLKMLAPIPAKFKSWRLLFIVLLSLKDCFEAIEKYSEISQAVEIQNCLNKLAESLQKLGVEPPSFSKNFRAYLSSVIEWVQQTLIL